MIDEKKLIEDIKGWQEDIHDNEYDAIKYDFVFERIYEMVEEQPKVDVPDTNVGEWIPVSERLPENGCGVLVTVNGKHNNITFVDALEIAEYDNTEGWIVEEYLQWTDPDVTAWMPLPEPYKESEEE